jgi:hypothetical protein
VLAKRVLRAFVHIHFRRRSRVACAHFYELLRRPTDGAAVADEWRERGRRVGRSCGCLGRNGWQEAKRAG